MWTFHWDRQLLGHTARGTLEGPDGPMTWAEVIDGWLHKPDFADAYSAALAGVEWTSYFWETPPLCMDGLEEPFEWVLIDGSHLLDDHENSGAFQNHFQHHGLEELVIAVNNLGGDCRMVVPMPLSDPPAYAHLAQFLRKGRPRQIRAAWKKVAEQVHHRVGNRPLWLSTAGCGLPWVHFRIDRSPKYLRHAEYKEEEPVATAVAAPAFVRPSWMTS